MKHCPRPRFSMMITLAGLLLGTGLPAQRLAETDPDYISWIPKVNTPPVIDGEIDDIWHAQAPFIMEFVERGTVENAEDLSAQWYGLYDDENFYFLVEVTDQFLESAASPDNWRNDWVEVYYNMDNVKPGGTAYEGDNYQYGYSFADPTGPTVVSNGSREGIEFTPLVTETGYRLEVKVPFATLIQNYPLSAVPGFSFGFDIAVNDNDGLATYDSVTYWWNSTGSAEWGNINGTGTVGLGDPFDGNFPPQVQAVAVQNAFEGEELTFDVGATDANEADSLTYSLSGQPSFASVSTNPDGTGTVTVNAAGGDAGTYTFAVVASDGAKEGTTDVTLVVRDPNLITEAPVFDPVDTVVVKQGNYMGVHILVTDNDSTSVTIEGTELPAFATLQDHGDKTATLAVSLDYGVFLGTYPVTLLVTDEYLNTDSITFNIQVVAGTPLAEYYCDPVNGSIENDGSQASPWGSLEEVFAVGKTFTAGNTIYLLDGYHGEPVVAGTNTDFVYITSAEGAEPKLAKLNFNTTAHYWHVSGLNISRSYKTPYSRDLMVGIGGSYNVLSNCYIFSRENSSGWTASQWISWATDAIVVSATDSVVEDCTLLNVALGIQALGDNNIIRRNHIQNFRTDGMRGLGNNCVYEYNYIADCINVDDNHDDAFQSWAPENGYLDNVVLRGNVVVEYTDPGRTQHRGPLQGFGCFSGMFRNWIIEDNVIGVTAYHGIALYGAIDCRIVNNTVVECNGVNADTWIAIYHHGNRATVPAEERERWASTGNLVRNNLVTHLTLTEGVATADHNLVIGVSAFPSYFVDFPYDLRLKEGSPAIDAGSNDMASTSDADGKPRPLDGNGDQTAVADVGAYEFGNALWRGLVIDANYHVWSGDLFGWLYMQYDPWIYLYEINNYVYLPPYWPDLSQPGGGWIWIPR